MKFETTTPLLRISQRFRAEADAIIQIIVYAGEWHFGDVLCCQNLDDLASLRAKYADGHPDLVELIDKALS